MSTHHLEKSDVPATLRAGYNGRKFKVRICDDGQVSLQGDYWDGGSRNSYKLVQLTTGAEVNDVAGTLLAASDLKYPPQFGGRPESERTVTIPEGWCVVEHSIFCGKDMGLTFHMLPADVAPLLPKPAP